MVKNVNDCIDLIERLKKLDTLSDQEVKESTEHIQAFLKKRYGKELTEQIDKLLKIRAFDRIIELLNAIPKKAFQIPINPKTRDILFLLILAAGGISFIILGITNVIHSKNSGRWPSTEGVITKSRVGRQESLNNNSFYDYADIEFSYSVNGKQYVSDNISYAKSKNPISYVNKYPVGKKIQVYYNTENPKVSVLEPGFSSITFLWFLGGLILFFFFFLSLYLSRKK